MANYNFRLELSKLDGFGETTLIGRSGVPTECIVIPKKANHIYKSQDTGRCYLDITCFETPGNEYGTHRCVRSKSQEEQAEEKRTGERINTPILGNLKAFGSASAHEPEQYSTVAQAPAAQSPAAQRPAAAAPATATQMPAQDDDQLPF